MKYFILDMQDIQIVDAGDHQVSSQQETGKYQSRSSSIIRFYIQCSISDWNPCPDPVHCHPSSVRSWNLEVSRLEPEVSTEFRLPSQTKQGSSISRAHLRRRRPMRYAYRQSDGQSSRKGRNSLQLPPAIPMTRASFFPWHLISSLLCLGFDSFELVG